MIGTVVQRRLEPDHRVACGEALFHTFAQALFNGGEEVFRHAAADDRSLKHQLVAGARFKFDPHVAVLPVAAGLFLMPPLCLDCLADGLAVGNLRYFQRHIYAEFVFEL